jgi:hypothetical protein
MRNFFIAFLLIAFQSSFAQSTRIDELIISGSFKLDKGHKGHNQICILDADKNDTVQVLNYATDQLLQKGVYSITLEMNRNYAVYFLSDGYEDIWKPLKVSISTRLPKSKKSIESQKLVYNVTLNMGHNKETFISYDKLDGKFEFKSK